MMATYCTLPLNPLYAYAVYRFAFQFRPAPAAQVWRVVRLRPRGVPSGRGSGPEVVGQPSVRGRRVGGHLREGPGARRSEKTCQVVEETGEDCGNFR